MRFWSLHPSLLDSISLMRLWKNSLKAQKLLAKNPLRKDIPELLRFTQSIKSQEIFAWYMEAVFNEAHRRNLDDFYNREKINITVNENFDYQKKGVEIKPPKSLLIPVTDGQLWFEYRKLLNELENRDEIMFNILLSFDDMNGLPPFNPIFKEKQGDIEFWDMDWYENAENKEPRYS